MAGKTVAVHCPACHWRITADRAELAHGIHCPNCRRRLRVSRKAEGDHATAPAAVTSARNESGEPEFPGEEDYQLVPPEIPTSDDSITQRLGEDVEHELWLEQQRKEVALRRGHPQPGLMNELAHDYLERAREAERKPAAPPLQWPFFSGVFTFPWHVRSLLPWIVVSLSLALYGVLGFLVVGGIAGGSREGAIMAGFLLLGLIWLTVLAGGYACACFSAIVEFTAYNDEGAYEWPDPDWRERVWYLLWLAWHTVLASGPGVTLAYLVFEPRPGEQTAQLAAVLISVHLFTPIFLLSSLEANSAFWPFSADIGRSVLVQMLHWILFYLISGFCAFTAGYLSLISLAQFGFLGFGIAGPLMATFLFIYARLLGRLAWRIMRPSQLQIEAWREAQRTATMHEQQKAEGDEWESPLTGRPE